jgi:pentatricopeptide repeat protein
VRTPILRKLAHCSAVFKQPPELSSATAGIPGDGHTYAALTRGYAQAGELQRALGILDHMVEAGMRIAAVLPIFRPNPTASTTQALLLLLHVSPVWLTCTFDGMLAPQLAFLDQS